MYTQSPFGFLPDESELNPAAMPVIFVSKRQKNRHFVTAATQEAAERAAPDVRFACRAPTFAKQ
jgi:hypothetical protein